MQPQQLIQVDTFCVWHNVGMPFINRLHEYGLIQLTVNENKTYIKESDLAQAERLIRLHNDLDVNLEGVEVIINLLEKLKYQQEEINLLQNKLIFYET